MKKTIMMIIMTLGLLVSVFAEPSDKVKSVMEKDNAIYIGTTTDVSNIEWDCFYDKTLRKEIYYSNTDIATFLKKSLLERGYTIALVNIENIEYEYTYLYCGYSVLMSDVPNSDGVVKIEYYTEDKCFIFNAVKI